MSLQYMHIIFLPHDVIYFVKCTSKALPQHDAAIPVLHGWDGVLQLASVPIFPPNLTMVIMAKQLYFLCHQTRGHFSKKYDFLSPCAVANRSLAFFYGVYICVLLFVQMNVVPSGVWKLLPRMNQACGGLQLFFLGLGWFLLITPPIDSNYVN